MGPKELGHTARKWQGQDSNPGCPALEAACRTRCSVLLLHRRGLLGREDGARGLKMLSLVASRPVGLQYSEAIIILLPHFGGLGIELDTLQRTSGGQIPLICFSCLDLWTLMDETPA